MKRRFSSEDWHLFIIPPFVRAIHNDTRQIRLASPGRVRRLPAGLPPPRVLQETSCVWRRQGMCWGLQKPKSPSPDFPQPRYSLW